MSKYQNKDERDIPRTAINGAPYNPRKISRDAQRRLRDNIKRHKLHGALTVNERTVENGWSTDECGFYLVSGHQRLSVLDALEKSDAYDVRCAVAHWTPTQEREQVLHFNAPGAQGDTDIDLLRGVFDGYDLDIDATGYDAVTLEDFGILAGPITEDDNAPDVNEMAAQMSAIAETSREVQEAARDAKQSWKDKDRANDKGASFLIHLAFRSSDRAAEVTQLLDDAGFTRAGEYFSGEALVDAMGLGRKEA